MFKNLFLVLGSKMRESKSSSLNFLPKILFSLLVFVSFFFVVSSSVYAATYYVDSDITDTHVGSSTPDFTTYNHLTFATDTGSDSVYKTIADINATSFAANDQILFRKGQTWSGTLVPSADHLTFSSFGISGAKPILDGGAASAIHVTDANRGYTTVDGLDLRSSGDGAYAIYHDYWTGSDPYFEGSIPGWTVKNCTFNARILLFGPNTTIQNNTFDGTGNIYATRGALMIRGAVSTDALIENNTVANWAGRGIWIFNQANQPIIRFNTVQNISLDDTGAGDGIDIDGYGSLVNGAQIYNNTISTCAKNGIQLENSLSAPQIYNNKISNATSAGIYIINYDAHVGEANNGIVFNNIIYGTQYGIGIYKSKAWGIYYNTIINGVGSYPKALRLAGTSSEMGTIDWRNNITNGTGWSDPYMSIEDESWPFTNFDYDRINSTNIIERESDWHTYTLAELQGLGYMNHAITADPQLTADYHLLVSSPCKDTAISIVGITTDLAGTVRPQGSAPDIGAYEYIPLTVTINQSAGQADPTNSTINFTVIFSESISDFITGDVTLSGTAGATTATVTGSGTTYNVAVTGMTGSGTVIASIAADKATGATGNTNETSTSTDNTVTYDNDAPTLTSITMTDTSGYTSSATPTITIVSSGSPSNVAFSCDGGTNWSSWIVYADSISSFNITNGATGCTTSDGSKTITAKLKDTAGNESGTANDTTYYDTTTPTLSSKTTFSGWYTANQTSIFTYTDSGGSGIVSGTPVTCNITTEGSAQTCSVTPNVCDALDNCNTTIVTSNGANIDKTAPVTNSSGTDSSWHNTDVTVTLSCTDTAGSGCASTYYTTDGTDPTTLSSSGTSVALSTSGTYTVKYFSKDTAGNSEIVKTAANQVKIDKTAPTINTPSTSLTTNNTKPTWTWTASTDSGSGLTATPYTLQWSQDASFVSGVSSSTSTTNSFTHSVALADGTWYFRVKATDAVGNDSSYSSNGTVVIDTTAPTISSITSTTSSGNYTTGQVINITVNFSENVTSTGNITVTLNTTPSRTCTFTVLATNTGGCTYPVQAGDTDAGLEVSGISGTIKDGVLNSLTNYTPATALSASKTMVIDTTAPTITATTATSMTNTGATITWTTGEVASSKVDYGLTNSYGSSTTETDTSIRVASHSVVLSSLVACTTYHYRVKSKDSALNETIDSDNTFTTTGCSGSATVNSQTSSSSNSSSTAAPSCGDQAPGAKAPWLYGAIAQDSGSVLLYFTEADDPVNKYVLEYGTKSGDYPYGSTNIGGKGARTFLVQSLSPSTKYYFRVRGGNGCATGTWSNEISAKTKSNVEFNQLDLTSQPETVSVPETPPTVTKKNGKQAIRPTPTPTEEKTQAGYDVKVKVVDTNKKPVEGATVTLHSTPQTAKTDKNGIAAFKNVEAGDHKVLIAYSGYSGEQSINLTGDVKEFDLTVTIQQKAISLSPLAYGIIGIMGLVIIMLAVLMFKLWKTKK